MGISIAVCACGTRDELSPIRDALEAAPGIAPRVSIMTRFRPCGDSTTTRGTIPVASCTVLKTRTPGDAVAALRAAPDSQQLHLAALVDLAAADSSGRTLERSISALRRASVLSENPAPVLADLAAALIVRAERNQAPRDLLEAYEIAERAIAREPRNQAALYNRALAIERLGLVDTTRDAWTAFLAADPGSPWAAEAAKRLRHLHAVAAPAAPAIDAPASELAEFASADPQRARELGMNQLLGEWGDAVSAADTLRAADRLRRAAALGEALRRRPGGDQSLADAVEAIRHSTPSARTRLAHAHRAYRDATHTYDAAEFEQARSKLTAAFQGAMDSPALRGWTGVYLATVRAHLDADRNAALAGLRQTIAGIDARRYPAMSARARWSYGNTLSRAERWEAGLDQAIVSARMFASAGERENEGAALAVAASARFVLGEPDSGYAVMARAFYRLRPYRASLRAHNLLAASADRAADDGLSRTAILLSDEDLRVSGRLEPKYVAEALVRRARHRVAVGEMAGARADLRRARPMVAGLDDSYMTKWLRAELNGAEALALLDANRRTAAFDSSAAFFSSISLPIRLLPTLVVGAEARLAAGDSAGASRRLEAVMRMLEHRQDSIRMEPRRAAVFEAARAAVDRLVMLKLREGRVEEALRYVDRAHASLAPSGTRPSTPRDGPLVRPGEVAVAYTLVGDTLLTWTVAGRNAGVVRTPVDTARLVRTLERLEASLEAAAGEAEVRPALSQLYEWLVRPVEVRLGATETPVVVVVDGRLAAVPFAALYDARRGRYWIDDHPLRFAVSLSEAARSAPPGRDGESLFVADPAFIPGQHPLLNRLSRARNEARNAAGLYPGATVLDGTAATPAALLRALPRAKIAHFGGHAVFDDARPERSYLVLAAEPGNPAGRLTAAELSKLDLHRVRLVVLSACRTMRTGQSRAAGYSGFSGALLAAGAAGTVGSTWNVEEGATEALMTAFHRSYAARPDGPGALRAAQRALAHGNDAALRSPSAWAGFRYAGS